jgi:hypothetical protein
MFLEFLWLLIPLAAIGAIYLGLEALASWLLGATPVVAVLYSLWFASRRDHRS